MARTLTVKFAPVSGADLQLQLREARARRQAILADPEATAALQILKSRGIDRHDLVAVYDDFLVEGISA